jgi:hypothetical protein
MIFIAMTIAVCFLSNVCLALDPCLGMPKDCFGEDTLNPLFVASPVRGQPIQNLQLDAVMHFLAVYNSMLCSAVVCRSVYEARRFFLRLPADEARRFCTTTAKSAITLVAICAGAYAGYAIPTQIAADTHQMSNVFLGALLADLGGACLGAVAGVLTA